MMRLLNLLIAIVRMSIAAFIIVSGAIALFLTSPIPIWWRGEPIMRWIPTFLARFLLWVFNVDTEYIDRERFYKHTGFIFPNHDSYLDIIIPASVRPVRFLAKAEIQDLFLIGWMAKKMGTIFVQREDKQSRKQARFAIQQLEPGSPILLFPEGGIDGVTSVEPFRHGAFELAIEKQFSILPAAITFFPFEVAVFDHESLVSAIWRLAKAGELRAKLIALPLIEVETYKRVDVPMLSTYTRDIVLSALHEHGEGAYGYSELEATLDGETEQNVDVNLMSEPMLEMVEI